MEIKDIRRIVEMMKNNDLTEFSMKDEDFELSMKRGNDQQVVMTAAPAAAPVVAAPAVEPSPVAAASKGEPQEETNDEEGLIEIPSPIVGTFYRRPSPDTDNFVQIGSDVSEDTVVCIIEAMKVMNEVKAEVKGVIRKILVDDASPVQYGQTLFLVEPS